MLGLMQQQPLLISSILRHAARHHGRSEIISKTLEGTLHRYTYGDAERRVWRLARALVRLGIGGDDRVGTLAWNSYRHFEVYYATTGMRAICHTTNPRLSHDDIAFIIGDAGDRVLFADATFVPIIESIAPRIAGSVRAIVMLTDRANMPEVKLPAGMDLLCYEELLAGEDESFDWPGFDENQAAVLCYTSGTTGRPKGVLYSHRSTMIHAYALNAADVFGLRASDRVMPVVPMFHVNAWGIPFAAPMAGSTLIMPGRHLDGASVQALMDGEGVTFSAGVPTVWMGLLQYLRSSGKRLSTLQRLVVGGSACPPALMEAFDREYGVKVFHAWGMSETSPLGTYNQTTATTRDLPEAAARRLEEKQGRALFGIDMKIVNDAGTELPWDGVAFGNLMVRGPWVCQAYFNGAEGGTDATGWFATGDVATIDPDGFMEITDRTKDVVKSGGEWISSIALENLAVAHPDVAEAAVIAARHPKWDERPLLLLVAKAERTVDPHAVRESFRGKVADWWLPDEVLVVDELPHTATGKLSKLRLREQYRDWYLQKLTPASGQPVPATPPR